MGRADLEERKPIPSIAASSSARILGVIPARGGSRGVPRKNIRSLAGKPLLTYVLTEALKSKLLTRVVVSSEDPEILSVAKRYGRPGVALKRPQYLARDTTPDVPVLRHALRAVEREEEIAYEYVMQIHATTPFVAASHIDEALGLLLSRPEADSVVSVYNVRGYHPLKLKRIIEGRLHPYVAGYEERTTQRRQDLDHVYKRNAGLYASKRRVVMEEGRVFGDHCLAYLMPYEFSFEVDTPVDFLIVDFLMRHYRRYKKFRL